jgi:hypothetical protein
VITKQNMINKDSSVINNDDRSTPWSQPSHRPQETFANGETTDFGLNIGDERNDSK